MSRSLSSEEVEWLREGYRLFREHDAAYMDRFEPNATFVFPTTLPAGGTYESPWEALEFWTTVSERVEDPYPEPAEFIRDGDRLVVLGTWHAVVPTTGRRVTARFVHIFRLSDRDLPLTEQKATSVELIADTAVFGGALAEGDTD